MLYDPVSATCKLGKTGVSDWASTLSCSSANRGDIRLNSTQLVMCDGTAWRIAYTPPLGSIINPAASCAALVASGDFSLRGNGVYYLRMSDNSVRPQVCEGSTNRGGDGSSTISIASSCATVLTYFSIQSGRVYIDSTGATTPVASNAILNYCFNGVSEGGDGSTAALSSASCLSAMNRWGLKTAAQVYVNSNLV